MFVESGQELVGFGEDRLQSLGLKHRSKVIVKHSLLSQWVTFCECYDSAQKSKQQHRIKSDVDAALQLLKLLQPANFFVCYSRFDTTVRVFSDEFADFLDQSNKYIEYAAGGYFSKFFNDSPEHPQIEIKCKPKENAGAQGGLICEVLKREVTLGKFHVKTHFDTAIRSSNHTSPDLRELFVYRLLEAIKIGPEVHFIPNTHYSTFALYIATKDVIGFKQAHEARSVISGECKLQLELLPNYGLDGDKNLCIVDFQVDHHTKSADVKEYLYADKEERIRVGKLCFTNWNLAKIVEDVDNRIDVQKALFKEKRISFLPSKNYNEYLSQVKKNITMFGEVFV
ncbi:unnamed protein product, partial [Mesorhabditis spiculigera]